MKNAEAFILSSLWEDPGFVMIEASALKKIVINTDSEKAIRIARRLNVNYWRRESYFASSKCKNSDFWKHIAQTTEGDYILFINCTSPLIKDSTIKNVIKTIT